MKLKLFVRLILLVLLLINSKILCAQSDKLGTWNIVNLNYHVNSKFSVWGELQARSQTFFNNFLYHEAKTGVNYQLDHKISFGYGLGSYKTYTYPGNFEKPVTASEFRMWEQFVLKNDIGRVKIEHRYRIEQRWINGNYSNRFRYRLNPVVPINHSSIIPNTIFMSVFDEVLFTDKPPYFTRNRFFVGSGYQFSRLFTLQIGFTRQFDYNTTNNGIGKNYIQTSLLFNVNKTNREIHPSTHD